MNHSWASGSPTDGTPSARAYATQQDSAQETIQTTFEEAKEQQPCCDETKMLDQLEEALNVIPTEDKEAYLQACQIAPHFIETESNPILFLRREEHDLQAAAQRLVAYWTRCSGSRCSGTATYWNSCSVTQRWARSQRAIL
jgi:hypothetical protein